MGTKCTVFKGNYTLKRELKKNLFKKRFKKKLYIFLPIFQTTYEDYDDNKIAVAIITILKI